MKRSRDVSGVVIKGDGGSIDVDGDILVGSSWVGEVIAERTSAVVDMLSTQRVIAKEVHTTCKSADEVGESGLGSERGERSERRGAAAACSAQKEKSNKGKLRGLLGRPLTQDTQDDCVGQKESLVYADTCEVS